MTEESSKMICDLCKKESMVEGTLEGISFEPSSESTKWLSSGIYGIKAYACVECGSIARFSLDKQILKKMLKKK